MGKTWKKVELEIAKILSNQSKKKSGIRRIPVTGRQRGDTPDISHPTVSVEVKHRQSIPKWIVNLLEEEHFARSVWGGYNYTVFDEFKCVLFRLSEGLPNLKKITEHNLYLNADPLPLWINTAVAQARAARCDAHKACLVVLHQKGWQYSNSVCILFDFNKENT